MVQMVLSWVAAVAVLMTLFATSPVDGASAPDVKIDSFPDSWLATHCIQTCNCTPLGLGRIKHLMVECSGMSTFIKYLPPGTTDLSLNGNSVEKFTSEDLKTIAQGLKTVRNLQMSHGRLKEIPVLHGFPRLRTLDFSYNLLGNITPKSFTPLKRLKILNVTGNGLDCARFKKELKNVIVYCDDNPVSVITTAATFESEEGFQETMSFDLAPTTEEPSTGQAPMFREAVAENVTDATSDGGFPKTTRRNLDQTSTGTSSAFKVQGWKGLPTYGIYFMIIMAACFFQYWI